MSHPQILIPFSLPPSEHAKDLVKLLTSVCDKDGLAMLVSRAQRAKRHQQDDFSPALPHEVWLSEQFNPLRYQARKLNVNLAEGYWFMLNPVCLHIASNHLVLTDNRQLALPDIEARALFETAQQSCSEVGLTLVYGDAGHWFLRADAWSDLVTTTPDAACGHNIEIWSPKGQRALAWRKLQNEIQMEWFIHPVQEQRQQRGAKSVNGLWLWCGTRMQSDAASETDKVVTFNPDFAEFSPAAGITVLDSLIAPALAGDWSAWSQTMQELEQSWFKPLRNALKSGRLQHIELLLSNSNTLLELPISAGSLRRFWRSVNFNQLS